MNLKKNPFIFFIDIGVLRDFTSTYLFQYDMKKKADYNLL